MQQKGKEGESDCFIFSISFFFSFLLFPILFVEKERRKRKSIKKTKKKR